VARKTASQVGRTGRSESCGHDDDDHHQLHGTRCRPIESKKYYAQAIPEKWLTVFTHDPAIPWAYVEKDEIGKMAARKV
jgi:hypothetical protein